MTIRIPFVRQYHDARELDFVVTPTSRALRPAECSDVHLSFVLCPNALKEIPRDEGLHPTQTIMTAVR